MNNQERLLITMVAEQRLFFQSIYAFFFASQMPGKNPGQKAKDIVQSIVNDVERNVNNVLD